MKKTNMKKAITLIEIILAIVLIAIILGVTIPKLMTNSTKAEIKAVISSDVKSIMETAATWKKSSASAAGSYMNISGNALNSRLPSNMRVDNVTAIIMASGLLTGDKINAEDETGVQYLVAWNTESHITAATHDSSVFALAADFKLGETKLNWDSKMLQYAKDVFSDTIAEATNGDDTEVNEGTIKPVNASKTAVSFDCASSEDDSTRDVVCHNNILLK